VIEYSRVQMRIISTPLNRLSSPKSDPFRGARLRVLKLPAGLTGPFWVGTITTVDLGSDHETRTSIERKKGATNRRGRPPRKAYLELNAEGKPWW